MTLVVENEDIVVLDGYIDGNGRLQFKYGKEELSAHGDSIEAIHADEVEFRLIKPPSNNISATHEDDHGVSVDWEAVTGGVGHSFKTTMTEPAQVEVTPPKMIYVRAKPTGGLPDT